MKVHALPIISAKEKIIVCYEAHDFNHGRENTHNVGTGELADVFTGVREDVSQRQSSL